MAGQVRVRHHRDGDAVPRGPRARPRRGPGARHVALDNGSRRGRRGRLDRRVADAHVQGEGGAVPGGRRRRSAAAARSSCGTGTYSTAETLELTQAAEDAGADGMLVVTPYYNKPPQRGLLAALTSAWPTRPTCRSSSYNIPGPDRDADRARDAAAAGRRRPNIVAVKDSTGDFQGVSRLIAEAPPDFEVYSGDDWATFGYVCLGAVGRRLAWPATWSARRSAR